MHLRAHKKSKTSKNPDGIARRVSCLLAIMAPLLSGAFFAYGAEAMDRTDLIIGMKTLPLLNTKISGNIKVAIVYDPAQSSSEQEANSLKSIIDSGLDLPGDLSVDGVMVPTTQMGKIAGSRIALITTGLDNYYNAISATSSQNKILTMSTDLNCVRQNKCVLGIISKPRVEIYYSRIAAENAQISYGEAFTTLIKPVP